MVNPAPPIFSMPYAVLILLALLAVVAIVIGVVVLVRLHRANRAADGFEARFWGGATLAALHGREGASPTHPMAAVFVAAMDEWLKSTGAARAGVGDRIERIADMAASREIRRLGRGLPFLAAIATVAPLSGLAAGLWTARAGFLPMAAVGPALADALALAAAGLAAAVPAVLAHHMATAALAGFASRLSAFAVELAAILARQSESAAMSAKS